MDKIYDNTSYKFNTIFIDLDHYWFNCEHIRLDEILNNLRLKEIENIKIIPKILIIIKIYMKIYY